MRRDQKAVLVLIRQGAPVNAARPDGSTPLAWAVSREDPEIATALIQAGANVNAADENGETPLSLACSNGNLALARMLLDAKADPNAKRWSGDTPLMGAIDPATWRWSSSCSTAARRSNVPKRAWARHR